MQPALLKSLIVFACLMEGLFFYVGFTQILALGPAQLAAERALAAEILDDAVPDPTGGADHYHTIARPGWAGQWPPAWARDYRETVRIGGHVFYDSRRHA